MASFKIYGPNGLLDIIDDSEGVETADYAVRHYCRRNGHPDPSRIFAERVARAKVTA